MERRLLLSVAIQGTSGNDSIEVSVGQNDTLVATVNGSTTTYTAVQYAGGIAIDTGAAPSEDTLAISGLPHVATTVKSSGLLKATVGSAADGLRNVRSTSLTIGGTGGTTQFTVEDSVDAAHSHVTLSTVASGAVAYDLLSGLTPGSIRAAASLLVINLGNAGNTVDVDGVAASANAGTWQTVNLNTGTGNDTVNVVGTSGGTVLNIYGQNGHDDVNCGNDSAGILSLAGVINVTNAPGLTRLRVDDDPSPVGNIVLDTFVAGGATYGSLQGLIPGVLNFNGSALDSLLVLGSVYSHNLTVKNTPGGGRLNFGLISTARIDGVAANQVVNVCYGLTTAASTVTVNVADGRIAGEVVANTNWLYIDGGAGETYQGLGVNVAYDEDSLVSIIVKGGTYLVSTDLDLSFGHSGIQFDGPTTHPVMAAPQHVDGISLTNGATMALKPGASLFIVGGGTIDGTLDLGVNQAHFRNVPVQQLRQWVTSGLSGGRGITSSATDASHTVGYGPTDVKWNYYGDANLDGKVDFSDLLALSQNYGKTDAYWLQGDFNYDGKVDFADLLRLSQNYGKSLAVPASRRRWVSHA